MTHYSKGVETRNLILHHSLELFSLDGYDATSVAEICQQAEVSKGAFYHHFASKQDLFLALMTTWLNDVDGWFQSASDLAENVPEALENMAQITGGIFDAMKGGFPILLEFWTQASRQPEIWERAVAPYRRYLDFFATIIETGKAESAFDQALDPEPTARILMAVAMGLLLQASFEPDGANWQEVTQVGIRMIINGMRSVK
jgi:AcrR family transcriptional regulator